MKALFAAIFAFLAAIAVHAAEPDPAVKACAPARPADGARQTPAGSNTRSRRSRGARIPLIHIASHFKFNPGTEVDSFLVLGDGSRLSLRELREAGYNFRSVDLLTLSACETAVGGGADANGREVEGFGALAQQRGARAVMATLWPVADISTGVIMQRFYRLRADGAGMSKAEALRQAQLGLLRGEHAAAVAAQQQRGASRMDGGPRKLFVPDAKAPFAHPYFWAPFILMGNWL